MSQVIRKFANSGKIEETKPELFERKDVGKYDKSQIISGLYTGIDDYIKENKLSGDRAVAFKNSATQLINGIKEGTVTMNGNGSFNVPEQLASTGKTDKNWYGKIKNTSDNINGLVGNYALKVINSMPTYTEPAAKAKERFDANKYIIKELSKRLYGGNSFDENNWFKNRTEQERNKEIAAILKNTDYNKLFQEHDWTDSGISTYEDLRNRGIRFGTAIEDNKLDNEDYNSFAALGGNNLDKYLKIPTEEKPVTTVEGQLGKVDTSWNNSEYDRTIDDKGKYHIYKKGTKEEVQEGIMPGNVFKGTGNNYMYNGNIYNDSTLPEQYKQDIQRARQAQLNYYTKLSNDNPFTKSLKSQGYNYIANLSQFTSGLGNNILYGVYSNPSDTNGDLAYYLKDPNTGKAVKGSVELNNTLGQYQFIGSNGNVINLGSYNNGAITKNSTGFVNYNDTSDANRAKLMTAWMRNNEINNPATDAYKMVQNTLSKWIGSGKSPFASYDNNYAWVQGNNVMNVRRNPNGLWEWRFNKGFDDSDDKSSTKKSNTKKSNTQTLNEGGTLKAQLGVKLGETTNYDTIDATTKAKNEGSQENADAVKQSYLGRQAVSIKELDKSTRSNGSVLKDSDKVRLGAAFADLLSAGLGFVPGANIASAGIGAASSITEFGADAASDGVQWGDLGRLGMNLGMDALSLIPVGKTLKASSALGKIAKSIPLMMTLVNASSAVDPKVRGEYVKTLSKIKHAKFGDLDTGDFKNLTAIASLVLGTRNFVKSTRNPLNSSTISSDKKQVTAVIDGKEHTLNVKNSFFENTKGGKQVESLKNKFAEYYNKKNNLTGDKAIKAEDVDLNTKFFGKRPSTSKVAGTKADGNWLTNTGIGKYLVGYQDPNIIRGNKNIPFSDAWFYKGRKTFTNAKSVDANTKNSTKPVDNKPELLGLPAPGEISVVKRGTIGPSQLTSRHTTDLTNPNNFKRPESYQNNAVLVSGTPVENVNAKSIKAANNIGAILDAFTPKTQTKNLPAIPVRNRIKEEWDYNRVWDEAIHNKKDFGYYEVEPRHSIYSAPTPTELVVQPTVKDKNARYLYELINKPKQTSHNKNNNLPHKSTNKKKKTSKDDRVTKKAEGGLIQFLGGGDSIGRIQAKDSSKWNRADALKNYNWLDDITNFKNNYSGDDDWKDVYMSQFNGGEDVYDDMTKHTGNYFSGGYKYMATPLAKQRQLTFRGTNKSFDDVIRNSIVGYGATEKVNGKETFDEFAGDRTGNRTLGRGLSAEDALRFNNQLKSEGMELYDNGTGGYRLRRLASPKNDSTNDSKVSPNNSILNASTLTKGNSFNILPEDVMELGRMIGGLATNRATADLYKKGLKPFIPSTYENVVPLQGNYQAKSAYDRQANNLQNIADETKTSDASLDFLKRLEIGDKQAQYRSQGAIADSDMYYKTRMLGQQESDAAKARRVDSNNKAISSMNAIEAAKYNIDAAKTASDYEKVIAPYMTGIENRYRQNRAIKNQLASETYSNNRSIEYDTRLQELLNKYKDDEVGFNREATKLRNDSLAESLDYRRRQVSNPWMIQFSKDGSKLSARDRAMLQSAKDFNKRLLEDNKLAHKDSMESKREFNKLLSGLSSVTLALIKKGMQL